MQDIKQQVSTRLNVQENLLNEISIEDVNFEEATRSRINQTLSQLFYIQYFGMLSVEDAPPEIDAIPCKTYWLENTRDLVIFVWNGNQSKTIVIPNGNWKVRNDIVYN